MVLSERCVNRVSIYSLYASQTHWTLPQHCHIERTEQSERSREISPTPQITSHVRTLRFQRTTLFATKWFFVLLGAVLAQGEAVLPCWSQQANRPILQADDPQRIKLTSHTDNGLQHIIFSIPQGDVMANVPAEIAPLDQIWGTIALQPAGDSAQEKQKNRNDLKQIFLEVRAANGPTITMAPCTMPQSLVIPANCPEVTFSFNIPGLKDIYSIKHPCAMQPLPAVSPDRVRMPQVAVPNREFRCGVGGGPGSTICTVGNQGCPSVAGSPRCQWFALPEGVSPGKAKLNCYLLDRNLVAKSQINVVQPKIYGEKLLHVGDRGNATIQLQGLRGVKGSTLIFRNLSPETLTVSGGDYQEIPIGPQ